MRHKWLILGLVLLVVELPAVLALAGDTLVRGYVLDTGMEHRVTVLQDSLIICLPLWVLLRLSCRQSGLWPFFTGGTTFTLTLLVWTVYQIGSPLWAIGYFGIRYFVWCQPFFVAFSVVAYGALICWLGRRAWVRWHRRAGSGPANGAPR